MVDQNKNVPFSMTMAGFVVPLFTGLLSASCSFVILNLIIKSPEKLGTTYHRMMAIMSVFDVIASVFIALGTIMMPSDNVYEFKGPMLGNHVSCQIQGFCIGFGMGGGGALYTCLSWYFVCRVAFKMNADKIKRTIEPMFYSYSFFVAIFIPSYYLSQDFISPISNDSFCTIAPYPFSCETWNDCIWNGQYAVFSLKIVIIWVIVSLVLIVGAMIIIIWRALENRKKIKMAITEEVPNDLNDEGRRGVEVLKELRYVRVLFIQAFMYILAFLLTWSFAIASMSVYNASSSIEVAKTVLFPMQGLWNFVIFVFDKVFLVRHVNENEDLWCAIKGVFLFPEDTPSIVLTNIDILSNISNQKRSDQLIRFGILAPQVLNTQSNDISSGGAMLSYTES